MYSCRTNDSLCNQLKESTRELHLQIESAPLLSKIIKRDISLQEFKLLVKKFYAYIAPCENAINKLTARSLLVNREKSVLLKNDLRVLGLEDYIVSGLIHGPTLPELISHSQVLGYLYVMEGSTLGGQIISKILLDSLKLTPATGTSFFTGYGKNTRQMWNSFCQILEDSAALVNINETIEAAAQVYILLYKWMITEQ